MGSELSPISSNAPVTAFLNDPDEPVFASASVNLRKVWEAARKEAGISGVRFHDLRHTFATRMADAGMEMQELKNFGPYGYLYDI